MSQSAIRATLIQALSAYAAAHNPVLPIAREGVAFTKPANNGSFLEAFLIPANTISPNVAGERRRFLGDLQINIYTKDGLGAGPAETIAEEICQLFKMIPATYAPVYITAPPSVKRPVTDPAGYRVLPVLISYRMEAEN